MIATLVDWSKAFPRLDSTLGINSFLKNGVRASLIPIISSFFENRRMCVKWHGEVSKVRPMPAGGSQGSTFGVLGYLSQSNDNADCVPLEDRYKFMDDLSLLETALLTNVGLATYNVKQHVPSNLPSHNQIISKDNLKTQKYLDSIQRWTDDRMMVLNEKKTKNIIFNFSKENQFSTKLMLKNEPLEVVNETKLLGVYITSDLKWNKNTEYLVKEVNRRMRILHKAAKFTNNIQDLVLIYKSFVRSKLDQSASVWHSSLTKCNETDLERVQKAALRIILKERYHGYNEGLKQVNMESLHDRRELICLKFAKKALKLDNFKKMFPIQKQLHEMKTRNKKKYFVNYAQTERYRKSSIPSMQRLLNRNESSMNKI